MARMAEQHLDEFNAQSLANMAWVFATLDPQDEQLFKTLAGMAQQRQHMFSVQNLAHTA